MVSDYSIGDAGKKNDVVWFVIVASHDTLANICSYIAAAAPKDIKNIRAVPAGTIPCIEKNAW